MKHLILFFAKIILLAPCCLYLWGVLLPIYAQVLAWIMTGLPAIASSSINSGGIFNTSCTLTFTLTESASPLSIQVASIVLNMPVFIVLALASFHFPLAKKLLFLGLGIGVLFVSHIAFLLFALSFRNTITAFPEFPTALGQLLFCLPLLLWFFLFYREALALVAWTGGEGAVQKETPSSSDDDVTR